MFYTADSSRTNASATVSPQASFNALPLLTLSSIEPIGDGLDRSPAHPRVSGRPGTTNMQMRNLVKGSSLEADQIIQIRDGAFDALDKGFLRELTLAIYLVRTLGVG